MASVPDAEGLPDAEQRRFDLWLVVGVALLAAGREAAAVDVRVLLLKLNQTITDERSSSPTGILFRSVT